MARVPLEGLHPVDPRTGKIKDQAADVVADLQPIGVEAEPDLDELFGDYELDADNASKFGGKLPIGVAKIVALRYGLRKLYVDGDEVELRRQNPWASLPNLREPKSRKSIGDVITAELVARNDWLGILDPYRSVFARYMPEDEEDEEFGGDGQPVAIGTGGEDGGPAPREADPTPASSPDGRQPTSGRTDPPTPVAAPGVERIIVRAPE